MDYPGELDAFWIRRVTDHGLGRDGGWWVSNYRQAVGRIEDRSDEHRADGSAYSRFLHSPADAASALSDGTVVGDFGGAVETPDQVRARAFELLALADLAEVVPLEGG